VARTFCDTIMFLHERIYFPKYPSIDNLEEVLYVKYTSNVGPSRHHFHT
jgi:hypothetical protein